MRNLAVAYEWHDIAFTLIIQSISVNVVTTVDFRFARYSIKTWKIGGPPDASGVLAESRWW